MVNATFFSTEDWLLLWLYVLPLVLTQTWLLGFTLPLRWVWVGLQLLLFVCLFLFPIAPFLCLGALLGGAALVPFAALVVGFFCATFFLWQRALPWFARDGFQGRVPNLRERLGLSLCAGAVGWLLLPRSTQFPPPWFHLVLMVVVGMAVGQLTGRYLRR